MNETVSLIAKKIVSELGQGYELSSLDYRKLLTKLNDIKISIINHSDKEIRYNFYTETHKFYGAYVTHQFGQSHTVEYPPILKENLVIPILPIVNIQYYTNAKEFISSSYHELVHFFGIGEWTVISKNNRETIIEHYSGITRKQFIYSDLKVTCQFENITFLNEVITDWIAQFLYERIEKDIYHSGMSYRKTPIYNFLSRRIQTERQAKIFIGAYLTNRIDVIEDLLLSYSQFKRLKDLNSLK